MKYLLLALIAFSITKIYTEPSPLTKGKYAWVTMIAVWLALGAWIQ